MTLVGELVDAVGRDLGAEPTSVARLGGGDVAESVRIDLVDGRTVFAKTHASPPPGFFTTEALGLRWLRNAAAVAVPEVLAVSDGDEGHGVDGGPARLVLEWVHVGRGVVARAGDGDTEAELGRQLAALHRAGASSFGREDRRTTGSRGLPNEPCATWAEFYATQRLLPLARLARDGRALADDVVADLERLAGRLDVLGVPVEPPSRLHGDLWAGNRLVDADGRSWLIDPAAHGGHREFDLAMMALFGGFGEACVAAYDEAEPLGAGWRDRVPLHQVAPLVVHAIKFGGGYRSASAAAIRAFL
ncbi:fructosamine kinase family protein [Dermatobacter hominis]|uniref:fructosamine kinase family protein n=1 Tax=Dermatobacter hominis TaxID=2884263 RepID=UPI001D125FE1|nr:fructosamine kinase family protein [Dermatobacter hominis]UDY36544.1 fructosamine kinase family protein [Dermatobacter hominis]